MAGAAALPYISPISLLYLPHISTISPPYLPYTSPLSPLYLPSISPWQEQLQRAEAQLRDLGTQLQEKDAGLLRAREERSREVGEARRRAEAAEAEARRAVAASESGRTEEQQQQQQQQQQQRLAFERTLAEERKETLDARLG